MKAQLLVLSAAGLVLAASAAQAASLSTAKDRYVEAARTAAQARLADRGVDVVGKSIVVQVAVGARRLESARIAKSSGNPELDAQAVSALRGLPVADAPSELVGRTLSLPLGEPAPTAAELSAR